MFSISRIDAGNRDIYITEIEREAGETGPIKFDRSSSSFRRYQQSQLGRGTRIVFTW